MTIFLHLHSCVTMEIASKQYTTAPFTNHHDFNFPCFTVRLDIQTPLIVALAQFSCGFRPQFKHELPCIIAPY